MGLDVIVFFDIPFREIITRSTTLGFHAEQAIAFSLYYRKYLSYESVFERNDILVISNRSLRDSPFDTMKQVYNFLGVDYVENNRFQEIGYSHGTDMTQLSHATFTRLAELFYPDYKNFCTRAGLEYSELDPSIIDPTSNDSVKHDSKETREQA